MALMTKGWILSKWPIIRFRGILFIYVQILVEHIYLI